MTTPIPVLVNAQGGTAAALGDAADGKIREAFAAAGVAIDLHLVPGGEVANLAERFAGEPTVVVGGGDGTLGSAAHILAGGRVAMGILPVGTRNHLARELGVPLDLAQAAKLIAERPVRAIDLGRVNDATFVNNASVGLYPLMVRRRDSERRRTGLPKWLAALPAAREALRRLPHHRLRLEGGETARDVVTPMLFVGNNRYDLSLGSVGTRTSLSDGVLSVYAVRHRGRAALIGFALRTLLGLADPAQDFAALGEVADLTVGGASTDIDVAIDGEVRRLAMPLRFRNDPGALTVIAPPPAA